MTLDMYIPRDLGRTITLKCFSLMSYLHKKISRQKRITLTRLRFDFSCRSEHSTNNV